MMDMGTVSSGLRVLGQGPDGRGEGVGEGSSPSEYTIYYNLGLERRQFEGRAVKDRQIMQLTDGAIFG